MCQNPFSRGTFRVAYHMMEYDENKNEQDNSSHVTLQEQFNELQEMMNSGAISLNEYRVYHPLSNHFHELKVFYNLHSLYNIHLFLFSRCNWTSY